MQWLFNRRWFRVAFLPALLVLTIVAVVGVLWGIDASPAPDRVSWLQTVAV